MAKISSDFKKTYAWQRLSFAIVEIHIGSRETETESWGRIIIWICFYFSLNFWALETPPRNFLLYLRQTKLAEKIPENYVDIFSPLSLWYLFIMSWKQGSTFLDFTSALSLGSRFQLLPFYLGFWIYSGYYFRFCDLENGDSCYYFLYSLTWVCFILWFYFIFENLSLFITCCILQSEKKKINTKEQQQEEEMCSNTSSSGAGVSGSLGDDGDYAGLILKKSKRQKVPKRGPGVAELEKILREQECKNNVEHQGKIEGNSISNFSPSFLIIHWLFIGLFFQEMFHLSRIIITSVHLLHQSPCSMVITMVVKI